MSVSNNVLSPDFLRARGVQVTQALGDWLNRAMFIARTRQSQEDRDRYQHWALCLIEDAMNSGGVGLKDWSKQSPTMPPNAESRTPSLLSSPAVVIPTSSTATVAHVPLRATAHATAHNNTRDRLLSECSQRCPVELRPFLQRAVEAFEQKGMLSLQGQPTVSFLQVLHEAERLKGAHLQQQLSQHRMQYADAPPPSYANPYVAQNPVAHYSTHSNYIVPLSNSAYTSSANLGQPMGPPMYPATYAGPAYAQATPHAYPTMPPPHVAVAPSRTSDALDVVRTSKRHREQSETDGDRRLKEQTHSTFARIGCDAPSERHAGFVGRSTALERQYSRDEPTPDDIRPLRTLKKALVHIKRESVSRGMKYFAEQLKGMRQDIRVQDIRSALSVEVYETSARVCLDTGDLGDFNKCQSALKALYRQLPNARDHAVEFSWYRLAYLAFGGQFDALALELMDDQLSNDSYDGAVAICAAVQDGDGIAVVAAVMASPATHMKPLAQLFLQRHRVMWLGSITGSMRGKITSKYLLRTLGYCACRCSATEAVDGSHRSAPDRTTQDGPEDHPDWFIDGSFELAAEGFVSLLDVLKLNKPDGLDVAADLRSLFLEDGPVTAHRSKKKRLAARPAVVEPTASWDAQEMNASVQAYNQFLTTRRDAAGISEA